MFQILRVCKYEHIEEFQIYGERSCGTKLLQKSLSCFNMNYTEFYGHKHFMGFAKPERIEFTFHTMFVCIVRNPYHWLQSFFNYCHHVPHKKNNIESFLLDEWYSVDDKNKEILYDRNIFEPKIRYKNIFEMRDIKHKYMLNILPTLARNYVLIRYEDLIYNFDNIMKTIQVRFNLKKEKTFPNIKKQEYKPFNKKYESLINDNLNWETENSIGYYINRYY